jgi:hypothetical protein
MPIFFLDNRMNVYIEVPLRKQRFLRSRAIYPNVGHKILAVLEDVQTKQTLRDWLVDIFITHGWKLAGSEWRYATKRWHLAIERSRLHCAWYTQNLLDESAVLAFPGGLERVICISD